MTGKPGCFIGARVNGPGQDLRVELDWLETFLAVADRGRFTAASATVHRSQSRVSAHIAALERDLTIHQGRGSLLHTRSLGEGRAEVGGRVILDEVREFTL